MKVRVWNAYASNNSGSYTIVGWLPAEDVATQLAASLRKVIDAHNAWLVARTPGESPLAAFCREQGLAQADSADEDDWPQYSDDNRPQVISVGHQVMVHHPYTVTLPRAFGELIYKKGGRVQTEENHAHHPIAVRASFYWGWGDATGELKELQRPLLVKALISADGPLRRSSENGWPVACRIGDNAFEEPHVLYAAVFDDLVEGVAALNALAKAHSAKLHVRVYESPGATRDPFADARPSNWGLERYDVSLSDPGDNRGSLVARISSALGLHQNNVRASLNALPWTLARGVDAARAEAIAVAVRVSGATVSVARNDY